MNFINLLGCDNIQDYGGCRIILNTALIAAVRDVTSDELRNYASAVEQRPDYYTTPRAVVCAGGVTWFVQESYDDIINMLKS